MIYFAKPNEALLAGNAKKKAQQGAFACGAASLRLGAHCETHLGELAWQIDTLLKRIKEAKDGKKIEQ